MLKISPVFKESVCTVPRILQNVIHSWSTIAFHWSILAEKYRRFSLRYFLKYLGDCFFLTFSFLFLLYYRSPNFVSVRYQSLTILLVLIFFRITFGIYPTNSKRNITETILSLLYIIIGILIIGKQIHFVLIKQAVLRVDPIIIQDLGQHFILGFTDYNEITEIVKLGGVRGVYWTKRNFSGHSKKEVRAMIQDLKRIYKIPNLRQLLIAVDHEGGFVSNAHMAGMVSTSVSISELLNDDDILDREEMLRIENYSRIQADELSYLGINLNFSPVVDLKYQGVNTSNTLSAISLRAIHDNPKIITEVAKMYSANLLAQGIQPTLKHFPGIGQSISETHTEKTSVFDKSIEDLRDNDFIPFAEVSDQLPVWIMLSHITVPSIDPNNPISISKETVEIIRNEFGFDGVLITDDFSMNTIYYSDKGPVESAQKAINNGIDVILITNDPELYYVILYNLIYN